MPPLLPLERPKPPLLLPQRLAKLAVALVPLIALSCTGAPSFPSTPTASTSRASTGRPGGEITPPRRVDVPGKHRTLSFGELFIPDYFVPSSQPTHLVVWSLGSAWCAQQNFYDARKNAVLLTLNARTLQDGFPQAAKFRSLLEETSAALAKEIPGCPGTTRVCLGSFSGGYTIVRDLLRLPEIRPLITDVVLADSLYAAKVPGSKTKLDPAQMQPFLDFAKRAADPDDHARFIFSHLFPPEKQYRNNTTTLAASYLIDHLGVQRVPVTDATTNSAGARLFYRADMNNFHILGYAGMLNQDHFNHFYASADLLRMTSLPDIEPSSRRSAPAN